VVGRGCPQVERRTAAWFEKFVGPHGSLLIARLRGRCWQRQKARWSASTRHARRSVATKPGGRCLGVLTTVPKAPFAVQ
jgi:hypothetical protein